MGLITYENLEDGQKVTANVFNERFAQIVAQLNGNIDENNLKNAGISKEKLKAEVYESMYPIGSMYVNFTDSTNPATLLGFGTWSQVAGRVVVGYDAAQSEFNAAEKTGGHKGLQAHTHVQQMAIAGTGVRPMAAVASGTSGSPKYFASDAIGGSNSSELSTESTGSGNGENLPPYIVGYVWKRIS